MDLPFVFKLGTVISALLILIVRGITADVSEEEVSYLLLTSQNSNARSLQSPMVSDNINASKPVKFLVHGWTDFGNSSFMLNLAEALLKQGDYNVLSVDWHEPSHKEYPVSVTNTEYVGNIIGSLIVKLHREKHIPLSNFHVLGHSLGAHIAGFTGKQVKRLTGKRIARITGMDPAGPLFEGIRSKRMRLSKEDAQVVEVLHTNGGFLGYLTPLGSIDFYANNGQIQPNCKPTDAVVCSHMKGISYYADAVARDGVFGTQCKLWETYKIGLCNGHKKALMGGSRSPTEKGTYYVEMEN